MEAYRLLWRQRDELLRLGLAPVLASFILDCLTSDTTAEPTRSLSWLANIFPMTLFSVHWHRLVLLGQAQAASGLGIRWERRETRFLVRWLLLGVGVAVVLAIPVTLAERLAHQSALGYPIFGAIMLFAIFLTLRFSLALTAIAVDAPYSFAKSWSDTAGCGFQLLASTLLSNLPVFVCLFVVDAIASSIGLAQAAPLSFMLLDNAALYLALAAYTTVLSLAFRRATGWPHPSGAASAV